jgi:hypothetical protein
LDCGSPLPLFSRQPEAYKFVKTFSDRLSLSLRNYVPPAADRFLTGKRGFSGVFTVSPSGNVLLPKGKIILPMGIILLPMGKASLPMGNVSPL